MPLNTDINLIRVSDAMSELNAPDTDYLLVERLINAASARLEKECGTFFKQRTETFVLHGNGMSVLGLPGSVISVSSITLDPDTSSPTVLTALTDYRVLTDRSELFSYNGWPYGVQNVQVVALVGMASIPDDIQHACMELVKHYYQRQQTPGDFQSETLGEYSYTRFASAGPTQAWEDLPSSVRGIILGGNRRWGV